MNEIQAQMPVQVPVQDPGARLEAALVPVFQERDGLQLVTVEQCLKAMQIVFAESLTELEASADAVGRRLDENKRALEDAGIDPAALGNKLNLQAQEITGLKAASGTNREGIAAVAERVAGHQHLLNARRVDADILELKQEESKIQADLLKQKVEGLGRELAEVKAKGLEIVGLKNAEIEQLKVEIKNVEMVANNAEDQIRKKKYDKMVSQDIYFGNYVVDGGLALGGAVMMGGGGKMIYNEPSLEGLKGKEYANAWAGKFVGSVWIGVGLAMEAGAVYMQDKRSNAWEKAQTDYKDYVAAHPHATAQEVYDYQKG